MTKKLNPMRVLIVEDEETTARHLTDLLQDRFANVVIEDAHTRSTAIGSISELAESGKVYDAVILDLKLPSGEGEPPKLNADVFRALREKMESSIIIHTTSYPDDPDVTRFLVEETMKSPFGPRSMFLPRIHPSWPEEVCRVIDQLNNASTIELDRPLIYKSCFISYSHKDELFVSKLYSSLKDNGLDVWYAPAKMRAGVKLNEEIEKNVRLYDKFLLVLSETSMKSDWVSTEIRLAIDEERKSRNRKLIPIRLVSFDKISKWTCFNADIGKDMAVELREYFIPDFTHWKVTSRYQESVEQLLESFRK